ncbi:OLC1v1028821C1 [Oldenlandia corymbosa var. corymbosa]|uniref:OLC1v1028821C1 n=1 Tax=Oldenlandia corymbosa var. corymbosa TaxID=529605 RepID=A0AAV1CCL4_OLDCO|nr:OLC1v1028821C1 [Oldenlandia corymbosa var. corymbosa]
MGFLFHAIKIMIPSAIAGGPVFLFVGLWAHLKLLLIGALTRLGLYKPPPEDDHDSSGDNSNGYIFILDGTLSPSPVPIPIRVVTAAIKNRVPVVKFGDLPAEKYEVVRSENTCCSVCFEAIGTGDEVRELSRCDHVFHRECLDTWIDSGRITCPLCRSMLLPPKTHLYRYAAPAAVDPPQTRADVTPSVAG